MSGDVDPADDLAVDHAYDEAEISDLRQPETDLEWALWYAASDFSEYCYAASWHADTADVLPDIISGYRTGWGQRRSYEIEWSARVANIRALIEATGCTPDFDEYICEAVRVVGRPATQQET